MNTFKTITALVTLLVAVFQVTTAKDSTLISIDQIPRLPESFELVDYKEVFAGGVLFPDRVSWDSVSMRVGMSEAALTARLSDSTQVKKTEEARTREQQWQFLQGLLYRNNTSMHYYALVEVYYDKQLSGWFKTYEWHMAGVGTIRVHLHAASKTDVCHVWLMELAPDKVPLEKVRYAHAPDLVLVRDGAPSIEWDIEKNRVRIGAVDPR